jgi:hypothetical protein
MSRLSGAVKEIQAVQKLRPDEVVTNFMDGDSYMVNPLTTLKLVTASSIFGEPSYYRNGSYSGRCVKDGKYRVHALLKEFDLLAGCDGKTTTQVMEDVIDTALDHDFKATLEWAKTLRHEYFMRLNPQVIMVRAALHPKRSEFTSANPGLFNEIQQSVMKRADEPAAQLAYFMFKNKGKKNKLPSVLKRSVAAKLGSLGRYQAAKYKNHEIGIINAVRLTHANSPVLDELMKTGKLEVEENDMTWENLRSAGKSWVEILDTINVGHMAMLRNIRNVFTEIDNRKFCKKYLEILKGGVVTGKQFPFRYWSAMKAVNDSKDINHKTRILAALEECIDLAIANMPKLKGKTMCLSDNSGSAWGAFTSEYGSVTVAEIDNLSSVLTALCSDEGYVGKFGDRLIVTPVSPRNGALTQAQVITHKRDVDVGGSTEGGIWEFFKKAIAKDEHWDNIFIYSDQQAGTGGLYGTEKQKNEYLKEYGAGNNINVFKLVQEYRKRVNPRVNVFSVQTAGYNNMVIPEMAYRTHLMQGWTGKEASFAASVIEIWNETDGIGNNW